ncbi:PRC-barrel domain-containing protein [Parasphingorhabdus cellanae]|uniref:PRC-barrel domain-containing protein n=2 Tax=Parasphingorhabdus cellanae TaxID=2806553 RepID=A0ABX7T8A5_9SPHN|nr:PRC-barrel domain-containing protein [Parasphingorhabdus cellanae]
MLKEDDRTSTVIASDRVEGTAIYGADNDKIGTVDKLMIEKQTGRVTDAILSVGGFLGIGSDRHSLPWAKLDYDTELGGYKLDVTKEQLEQAPRFKEDEADKAFDRQYQTSVYEYWMVTPYW